MSRPVLLLFALVCLVGATLPSVTHARLTNVVTDWIAAAQQRVAALGVHNVPASRWYAQTALAIHNAVSAGGAPPQALAGALCVLVCGAGQVNVVVESAIPQFSSRDQH